MVTVPEVAVLTPATVNAMALAETLCHLSNFPYLRLLQTDSSEKDRLGLQPSKNALKHVRLGLAANFICLRQYERYAHGLCLQQRPLHSRIVPQVCLGAARLYGHKRLDVPSLMLRVTHCGDAVLPSAEHDSHFHNNLFNLIFVNS